MATLLLIDDQQSLRMLLKASLEGAGYGVVTAENGRQGLQLFEEMSVDAIVVDLFMPEMDGLEFISRIRKTNLDIKIIAMSGEVGFLGLAKQLGADDTISKPFSLEDLLTMVSPQLDCAKSRQPVP